MYVCYKYTFKKLNINSHNIYTRTYVAVYRFEQHSNTGDDFSPIGGDDHYLIFNFKIMLNRPLPIF